MKKFQALVNDQTFNFEQDDAHIRLNGEAVDYSFQPIGNGLYSLLLKNQSLPVFVQPQEGGKVRITIQGRSTVVQVKDEKDLMLEKFGVKRGKDLSAAELHAPMPGLVRGIYVEVGQAVKKGERVLVLEAMKMENELKAAADVVVKAIHVQSGDAVGKNALLVSFE